MGGAVAEKSRHFDSTTAGFDFVPQRSRAILQEQKVCPKADVNDNYDRDSLDVFAVIFRFAIIAIAFFWIPLGVFLYFIR